MFVRSISDIAAVFSYFQTDASDYEIARRTGVPRSTVHNWRTHGRPIQWRRWLEVPKLWRPQDEAAYSYLLGIYLGDGCLSVARGGSATLIITLDSRQQEIIAECSRLIPRVLPVNVRHRRRPPANVAIISATSRLWPLVFPQHGPGRKHKRKIKLEPWQTAICNRHPRELLRGLIHSDGSRCINRFSTVLPSGRVGHYAYVRYFFTNLSADIRGIFCTYCEQLGIRWTQSNARNISVSHRQSVALLDSFVGPKR
jgi:hypothetical protein